MERNIRLLFVSFNLTDVASNGYKVVVGVQNIAFQGCLLWKGSVSQRSGIDVRGVCCNHWTQQKLLQDNACEC